MIALFRKELRLASDVMIGALVFFVASFPLAAIGVYMQGVSPMPWAAVAAGGCVLNQYSMVLTGALIGAVFFAREREEGNHHFLALLPLTRPVQGAAKLLAALAIWTGLWAVNVLILIGITLAIGEGLDALAPFAMRMIGVAVLSFAAWGLASLAGCFIPSVTAAAFAGLAAVMATSVGGYLISGRGGAGEFVGDMSLRLLGILGIIGLGFATIGLDTSRITRIPPLSYSRVRDADRALRRFRGASSALLWKDARLLASSMWIGASIVLLPFVAASGNAVVGGEAAQGFRVASIVAMLLGWIILPMWSANGLASERAASSHAFLAYLPVPSKRILNVKLAVSFVPAAVLVLGCVASFLWAEWSIASAPPMYASMSWAEFEQGGFRAGAVAYACALPVTFSTAWFFAARLRRTIVAIVLGILSGPVAMASWAITSAPEGYIVGHFLPVQAMVIHATVVAIGCALLLTLGTAALVRDGFA